MQESTKHEIKELTPIIRQLLEEQPKTRGNDDLLYYQVCRVKAARQQIDINTLHFSTIFLGNPFNFPKYESVIRIGRDIRRANPELQPEKRTQNNRKKKEADMIEYARNGGTA